MKYTKFIITILLTLISILAYENYPVISVPTKVDQNSLPVELFANQVTDNLTNLYVSAIKNAKESVLLIVFSLTDKNVIDALREKSYSNVPVKIILDAKTSPGLEEKLGHKISLKKRYGDGLMHMKILVIDHKDVYLGSANMTKDSLKNYGNLVTVLDSPEMARLIEKKMEVFNSDGSGNIMGQHNFIIGGQEIELWILPDNNGAIRSIESLIAQAKKRIRIGMFTWTRRDLANAVISARRKGIDVDVVIDANSGRGAGAHIVEMLRDNGVNVRLSRGGPLLHHKFCIIDNDTLVNGSANWTRAAFEKNNDCFLVIKELNLNQQQVLDKMWKKIYEESLPPR